MDIHKDGHGIWFVIHTLALNVGPNRKNFEWMMTILYNNFGCDLCKPHLKKYMDEHPLKTFNQFYYKKSEIGYFKWSWELHNDVNKRLKKPLLSFEDALMIYKNSVCQHCDNPILIPIEPTTFNLITR